MIGSLFSMHSDTAVASITRYPSRRKSPYSSVSNRVARRVDVRVGGVDPVDLRALQERVGL